LTRFRGISDEKKGLEELDAERRYGRPDGEPEDQEEDEEGGRLGSIRLISLGHNFIKTIYENREKITCKI
jgi:hypothetical protein